MNAPDAKRHNAPCSNRDYDFFYEGLEDGKLLVQSCDTCNTLRHPPEPMCPHCHSVAWSEKKMSGRGTVFSYVVHRHPPLPGYDLPYPIGLIELEEGVRVVAGMDGTPPEEIAIGSRVQIEFYRRGDLASFRFLPA